MPPPDRVEIVGAGSFDGPFEAEIVRQIFFTPGAIFSHGFKGPPGRVIQHWFIHAAESVLEPQRHRALHLAAALVAEINPALVFRELILFSRSGSSPSLGNPGLLHLTSRPPPD